jgi:hypothetical protein
MAFMYNQVVLDKIYRYFVIKNAIEYLTNSCIFHVVKLLFERQLAHAQTFDVMRGTGAGAQATLHVAFQSYFSSLV